jgi:hypothetical protein
MALPATDTFNNGGVTADLSTYSANWTPQQRVLRVVSNALAAPADNQDGVSYWNADAFNSDHYSQVVMTNITNYSGVVVRASGTSGGGNCTGYLWLVQLGLVYRINSAGGSFTQIDLGWPTPSIGDTVRLSVSGNLLTGTINGGSATSKSDPTYGSGGAAGVYLSGAAGAAIDTWEGGNVGGGGGGFIGTPLVIIRAGLGNL